MITMGAVEKVSTPDTFEAKMGFHFSQPRTRVALTVLFFSLLQGGVFLSSMIAGFSYCLNVIHDDYFVPLLDRALRTDEDLLEEYTYYDRHCSLLDFTATKETAHELILEKNNTRGVDIVMRHGGTVIPQVLSMPTVEKLRNFVLRKNAAVEGTAAEFPVSQGHRRISYGIEAAEDPAVIQALHEIHDNAQVKGLVEDLVGSNPALSEITAITAKYGAPEQAWHPDTKPDGNALRFARTYQHSYSLFVALQDTTKEMGATDVCPGSHYCVDEVDYLCDMEGFALSDITGVWKAGDGALLNQHVWHRGGPHTAEDAPDRILFIVTFLARPEAEDSRQLARGTYFHMKWNMWGHTWRDMQDCEVSMAWPYNALRCLHLWKPADRQWGYDLFTSATLRIANHQGGCQASDLERFLNVLANAGAPEFLDGTIDLDDEDAWEIYISETIGNYFDFSLRLTVVLSVIYFVTVLLRAFFRPLGQRLPFARRNTLRLALYHGVSVSLSVLFLYQMRKSKWATDIESGKTLLRPFPIETELPTVGIWKDFDSTLTTFPERNDVLIGTRYTRRMGAYAEWLKYHPGNLAFSKLVDSFGGELFRGYANGLPPSFSDSIVAFVVNSLGKQGGRILVQNFLNGDWHILSESAAIIYTTQTLLLGHDTRLRALFTELEYQDREHRFEKMPGTALAVEARRFARFFQEKLLPDSSAKTAVKKVVAKARRHTRLQSSLFKPAFPLTSNFNKSLRRSGLHTPADNMAGRPVTFFSNRVDDWIPGSIMKVERSNHTVVTVALDSDLAYDFHATTSRVRAREVFVASPVVEGMEVETDGTGGIITRVYADGCVDIDRDDGIRQIRAEPADFTLPWNANFEELHI